MKARLAGAAALSLLAILLLHAGGSPWPPALLFGFAAGCFTAWRTLPGSGTGFALMLAAAVLAVREAAVPLHLPMPTLVVGLLLEVFGLGSSLLPRTPAGERPSRRLLGAWLASTGTLWLGVASFRGAPATASTLVCVAMAHRMGAFPAFGWAPLLLRHPDAAVARLGVLAFLAAGVVTVLLVPALPDQHASLVSLRVLGAIALPYTLWHARRQWSVDRRCARSYLAAAGASALFLVLARTA